MAAMTCKGCPLGDVCFQSVIEHAPPVHAGSYLVRQGEVFESIAMIRSGTVKTYSVDHLGREVILGFHLPGDFIGLGAMDEVRHSCSAVALDTVTVCRLPVRAAAEVVARDPALLSKLVKLMSREVARVTRLSHRQTADERLAAFLIGMAERMAAGGFSPRRWQLPMSRMDIASYLHLAPETLSRMFRRFQQEGLLAIDGRAVEVRELDRLLALSRLPASRAASAPQRNTGIASIAAEVR